MKIIFITGASQNGCKKLAGSISDYINYYHISTDKIATDAKLSWDTEEHQAALNNLVVSNIKGVETHYRGVVVSGFPRNFDQALKMQHEGILADRLYLLNFSESQIFKYYTDIGIVEPSLQNAKKNLHLFNLAKVKELYGQYCDEFDCSIQMDEEILENMKGHLKLRDHKIPPLRSPRIILVAPPHLRKKREEIFIHLETKYGLHPANLEDIVRTQIQEKTEIGKYLQRNQHAHLPQPDDIVNALIKTELQKPLARHKGWICTGFPTLKEQISFFQYYKLNPHLVIILDDHEDKLIKQYQDMLVDPETDFKYEPGYKLDSLTQRRLQIDHSQQDYWKDQVSNYKQFVKDIEQQFESKTQRFRISVDATETILKQIDVFINNPKIYS